MRWWLEKLEELMWVWFVYTGSCVEVLAREFVGLRKVTNLVSAVSERLGFGFGFMILRRKTAVHKVGAEL